VGNSIDQIPVLIVDDQRAFRDAARDVVSLLAGWHVVAEVGSGEEAVEAARAAAPDVVLMDINLPGIDGIQATRRIVAADPGVRVVLLSTYRCDDLPRDAGECGAVGYIEKAGLTAGALRKMLA
jgi:DNA-binding NarL/FixJ family response regulator